MSNVKNNAEMVNGMFNAAQIKRMIINGKKNAIGDLIIFDYKNYHIIIEKDYSLWKVTIGDKYNTIQMPDDDSVNVFVRGKEIPTYFLSERCGNDIDGKLMRWCGRVIDNIVAIIEKAILEYDGEPDENDIMEETDDMYEYAQEAYDDIEGYVEDAVCLYRDIERTLEDPDYSNLKDTITQLWERLEDIHNAFGLCLHRCDYLTGCDITFDDFCGTDYFSDIEIPGYMGWDLEELMYDGDPAVVLENILDNISRENPGHTDTLSDAIDGTGLYLAA